VREPLLAAAQNRNLPFLFGHLNESDTWGHHYGPDHPATLRAYAETDALVGEVADAFQADWERTIVIVVSDHGMEPVRGAPVDLLASDTGRRNLIDVCADGGVALVKVADGILADEAGNALLALPEVVAWRELSPGVLVVEGGPGARFATGTAKAIQGVHGGPGTVETIAVVGGGHSAVPSIAAAIAERPPHLADWAPTIAALLGMPFPTAEGQTLASAVESVPLHRVAR
jgi:arylsulfatase A-like enzyme